jgi:hypothetical protein
MLSTETAACTRRIGDRYPRWGIVQILAWAGRRAGSIEAQARTY